MTTNRSHLLLTLSLAITTLTLLEVVQSWVAILFLISSVSRLLLLFKWQRKSLTHRVINLLALLFALPLLYLGWQIGLLLAMLNLLMIAASLKLLRMANNRDYFQLVALAFFLIACGFIFQQSILYTLLYIFMVMLTLLSLAYHISPSLSWRQHTAQIGKFTLQSIPIGILLFLVLPQVGPLWQMNSAKSANTGLSEKVTPGDIANLTQSTELAFRASFNGAVPSTPQRYWRAIVLEQFDGKSWQISPQRKRVEQAYVKSNKTFTPSAQGPYFNYEVISEPNQNNWLYALDVAITSTDNVDTNHTYQLLSKYPVTSSFRYQVSSYFEQSLAPALPMLDWHLGLQVPLTGNSRTQAWVKQKRQQYPNDADFIRGVIQLFQQGNFRYTLNPPPMFTDPVDLLLFEHKAGFCSHYASAFAYIMRLAGIPARLVTGYLGGETLAGNTLSIYQYDAHAWVEIWYDQRGWLRYDPTVMVSPQRLSGGLELAVAYENSFLQQAPFALAKLKDIAWLNELRLQLEQLDFMWSRWVLGFDSQQQLALFEHLLGELNNRTIASLTFVVMLIIGTMLVLFHLPLWRKQRQTAEYRYYQKALRLLEQKNIERPPWFGPQAFSDSLKQRLPTEVYQHFAQITDIYLELTYGNNPRQPTETKHKVREQKLLLKKLGKSIKHSEF